MPLRDLPTKPLELPPAPTPDQDARVVAKAAKVQAQWTPEQRQAVRDYTDPDINKKIRAVVSGKATPAEAAKAAAVLRAVDAAVKRGGATPGVYWRGMYRVSADSLNGWLAAGVIQAERAWSFTRNPAQALEATDWAQPRNGFRVVLRCRIDHAAPVEGLSVLADQREAIIGPTSVMRITSAHLVAGSDDLIMVDCVQVKP